MNPREDHQTNYPEDAAAFEQWRGRAYDDWDNDRPTKAELDLDEWYAERGGRR